MNKHLSNIVIHNPTGQKPPVGGSDPLHFTLRMSLTFTDRYVITVLHKLLLQIC